MNELGFNYRPYRLGRYYDIGIYIRTPSGDRLKMFGGVGDNS